MVTPALFTSNISTSDSIRIATRGIGSQGEYGAVTELAREFGISRPTVYEKVRRGQEALGQAFGQTSRQKVLATVDVDESTLRRAVVSAYTEGPNSVRDVQALVWAFYGVHVGYGKIYEIIEEAERKAAEFNRSVSLAGVRAAALDELFSQGDPVLAGLDLDSDYLFLLEHREGRSGEDWAAALGEKKARGLDLQVAVKDAGTGLAAGVSAVFPNAQQRDDAFHVRWQMGQVQQRLEKQALAALAELLAAEDAYEKARTGPEPRYSVGQTVRRAREEFDRRSDRLDAFERLAAEAGEAMEFIGFDTESKRCGGRQAEIIVAVAERMAALGGKRVRQVARYLKNRAAGLAVYMDDLWQKVE